MIDAIFDAFLDSVKLLPFLFITYLVMEYMEKKTGANFNEAVKKSGKLGPLFGGILGAFPQCGFSAAASNLYAGHIITTGTLIAVYMSTSDEMLPLMLSHNLPAAFIIRLLVYKALIGMLWGFIIDIFLHRFLKRVQKDTDIDRLCEHEHCHCSDSDGIVLPAARHTIHIFIFVLCLSCLINVVIAAAGEDALRSFIMGRPFIGEVLSGLLGLVPNCASSIAITQLYLDGIIGFGQLMSGLLVGAGVGLMVLFRVNEDIKNNVAVTSILYAARVLTGCIIEALSLRM